MIPEIVRRIVAYGRGSDLMMQDWTAELTRKQTQTSTGESGTVLSSDGTSPRYSFTDSLKP